MTRKRKTSGKNNLVILLMLIVIFVVTCLLTSFMFPKTKTLKTDSEVYVEHVVSCGDTLWDIAEKYCSDHYDVRAVVYEISQTNDIEGAVIHSGDVLLVPMKYAR